MSLKSCPFLDAQKIDKTSWTCSSNNSGLRYCSQYHYILLYYYIMTFLFLAFFRKYIFFRYVDSLSIQPNLFDSRGSNGKTYKLQSIELENIRDLQVGAFTRVDREKGAFTRVDREKGSCSP